MSKRKFYEIEQDDGKASPTSNRVTKRAKLMNSSDSKFKNMKKTKHYIDKLTDLNAKKNIIKEEDRNSISDVEECSAIYKNKEKKSKKATNKDIFLILRRKKSIQSLNDLKKRKKNLNLIYLYLICLKNFQYGEMEIACLVH